MNNCSECDKEKSRQTMYEWYHSDPSKKLNYDKEHPEARRKRRRKHYENNKDKERERTKQFIKDNPENAKRYAKNHRVHDITKTEKESLLKIFNYQCAYCNMTLSEHKIKFHEKLHDDHVVHDGYNDLRNDVTACKTCNSSKGTEDMETWFRRQDFFTEEKLQKIIWWITEGYKDYIEDKPPYRITRKQNTGMKTYHWELWAVDEKRNFVECIYTGNKKEDIKQYIKKTLIK